MNIPYRKTLNDSHVHIAPKIRAGKRNIITCEAPVRIDADIAMSGSIGAYTYIRHSGRIACVKSIGRYCSIAPGVNIGDGQHPVDWLSSHPFQYGDSAVFKNFSKKSQFSTAKQKLIKYTQNKQPVIIGHDVWIGSNVNINQGVSIGHGAIIATGAVVTKDVPPYAIAAGIPAEIIRYRFNDDVIKRLLAMKWWDYEADSLIGIRFDDIEKAISDFKRFQEKGYLVKIVRKPIKVDCSTL